MNSFIGKIKHNLEIGKELAKNGTEYAFKKAEKALKIESIKVDISAFKKQTEKKMLTLAARAYEMYETDSLENPELIELCREIKMLRWKTEEKWNEIEVIKKENKDSTTKETKRAKECPKNTKKNNEQKEIPEVELDETPEDFDPDLQDREDH